MDDRALHGKRIAVTEGVYTASAVVEIAAARVIEMPIAQAVHVCGAHRIGHATRLIEDTSHSPVRDKTKRRQMMVDRALEQIRDWKNGIAATFC